MYVCIYVYLYIFKYAIFIDVSIHSMGNIVFIYASMYLCIYIE